MSAALKTLHHLILNCDESQLDLAFAILKYKEIGIVRKIKCWAKIFDMDGNELVDSFPKSIDNRVLDKTSRKIVHNYLMERIQK